MCSGARRGEKEGERDLKKQKHNTPGKSGKWGNRQNGFRSKGTWICWPGILGERGEQEKKS